MPISQNQKLRRNEDLKSKNPGRINAIKIEKWRVRLKSPMIYARRFF
jgi:hypothetical protein